MTLALKVVVFNHNQKESAEKLFNGLSRTFDTALIDSGSSDEQISQFSTHQFENLYWTGCWNRSWEIFAGYDVIWGLGGDCELLEDPEKYKQAIESAFPFGTWSPTISGWGHDYMKAEHAEGHLFSVHYLEGMAFAISRQLWELAGPFDPQNYIGHGQDLYCCYVSRRHGLGNFLDGRAQLLHPHKSDQYNHQLAVTLMTESLKRHFGEDWSDVMDWWLGRQISFKSNAISRVVVQGGEKRYARPFLRK